MRLRSEPFSLPYTPSREGQISAPASPDAERDAELRAEAQRLQRAQLEARPDSAEARRIGERLRQIDRERIELMRGALAAAAAAAPSAAPVGATGELAELGAERAELQRRLADPALAAADRRALIEQVQRIDRTRFALFRAQQPAEVAPPEPDRAPEPAPVLGGHSVSQPAQVSPAIAALPYAARRRAEALEREQTARRAHTERLSDVIARTVADRAPEVAESVAAGEATRAQLQELDAPLVEAPARTERERRAVVSRRGERARAGALPQTAKPPQHIPYSTRREEEAKRAAEASSAKARRRDTVYFPAWVREAVRRCARSHEDAARELGHVPVPQRAAIQSTARVYGGLDEIAGRNVIGLGIAIWYMAQRLKGRISGLPRAAWASLTVGAKGKHYSESSLFHACHSTDRPLDEERRGIYGGRVGAGRNQGFLVALCASGLIRLIVPSTAGAPPWMIAPSGWAYVQVLVCELGGSDNTS